MHDTPRQSTFTATGAEGGEGRRSCSGPRLVTASLLCACPSTLALSVQQRKVSTCQNSYFARQSSLGPAVVLWGPYVQLSLFFVSKTVQVFGSVEAILLLQTISTRAGDLGDDNKPRLPKRVPRQASQRLTAARGIRLDQPPSVHRHQHNICMVVTHCNCSPLSGVI